MLQQRSPNDFGKDFAVDPISLDVEMTLPQAGPESVKAAHAIGSHLRQDTLVEIDELQAGCFECRAYCANQGGAFRL